MRKGADAEYINLRLKRGNRIIELRTPLRQRPVLCTKPTLVDHSGLIQVVELVRLGSQLRPLLRERRKLRVFDTDGGILLLQLLCNLLRSKEEPLEFLMEDRLKVVCGNLGTTGLADVLGTIRRHIHDLAAVAVCDSGKEMSHVLCDAPSCPFAPLHDRRAFLPEFLGNDGWNLNEHPFRFRFEYPRFRVIRG